MPRVSVQKECGHFVRIPVSGTPEHQAAVRRETARGQCFECVKTTRTVVARDRADADGLPPLHGTPRQIDWAETIRNAKLAGVETITAPALATIRAQLAHKCDDTTRLQLETDKQAIEAARDHVRRRTSDATFWIDNRDLPPASILAIGIHGTQPEAGASLPMVERLARIMQWIGA